MKTGIHASPKQRETNQAVTRTLHARPGPTNSQVVRTLRYAPLQVLN